MASEILLKKKLPVEQIFERAKDLKFSKCGEMFSCEDMKSLAQEILGESFQCSAEDSNSILDDLNGQRITLIPYDIGKDQHPCEHDKCRLPRVYETLRNIF